jgi:hypothetical protein
MDAYFIEFKEYKRKLRIMVEPGSVIAVYQIERNICQSIKLRDRTR